MRLKTMCDEALKVVEEAEERYKERAKITEHSTFLKDKYKDDRTALEELPHIYLNDKRLRTLSSQLAEATALYEAIATAYERRTGKKHQRHASEQFNKPLEFDNEEILRIQSGSTGKTLQDNKRTRKHLKNDCI